MVMSLNWRVASMYGGAHASIVWKASAGTWDVGPHSHHVWTIVYFIFHHTLFWFGYSANEVVTWALRVMNMVMWVALIKSGPPLLSAVAFKLGFISFIAHWLKLVGFTWDVAARRWAQHSDLWAYGVVVSIGERWHLLHGDLTKQLRSLPLISWTPSKTASCSLFTWIPSLVFYPPIGLSFSIKAGLFSFVQHQKVEPLLVIL